MLIIQNQIHFFRLNWVLESNYYHWLAIRLALTCNDCIENWQAKRKQTTSDYEHAKSVNDCFKLFILKWKHVLIILDTKYYEYDVFGKFEIVLDLKYSLSIPFHPRFIICIVQLMAHVFSSVD